MLKHLVSWWKSTTFVVVKVARVEWDSVQTKLPQYLHI